MGRYGPVVQTGESANGNKPKFAGLLKNQLIETITLEEALNLFRLPRSIGKHEGEDIIVGIGKFGPYLRHNNKFYSLKKGTDDPYFVTFERALEVMQEKTDNDKQKVLKDFSEIQVLNGRYGPYVTKDKKNYRLPKGLDPASLTKEDCIRIIESNNKPKKSARS
jgi:DNA topoisomerase-1